MSITGSTTTRPPATTRKPRSSPGGGRSSSSRSISADQELLVSSPDPGVDLRGGATPVGDRLTHRGRPDAGPDHHDPRTLAAPRGIPPLRAGPGPPGRPRRVRGGVPLPGVGGLVPDSRHEADAVGRHRLYRRL